MFCRGAADQNAENVKFSKIYLWYLKLFQQHQSGGGANIKDQYTHLKYLNGVSIIFCYFLEHIKKGKQCTFSKCAKTTYFKMLRPLT